MSHISDVSTKGLAALPRRVATRPWGDAGQASLRAGYGDGNWAKMAWTRSVQGGSAEVHGYQHTSTGAWVGYKGFFEPAK
ncbi:MAG TPA: hypothetical protein VGM37_05395 [Armatimonadota bacterium]